MPTHRNHFIHTTSLAEFCAATHACYVSWARQYYHYCAPMKHATERQFLRELGAEARAALRRYYEAKQAEEAEGHADL